MTDHDELPAQLEAGHDAEAATIQALQADSELFRRLLAERTIELAAERKSALFYLDERANYKQRANAAEAKLAEEKAMRVKNIWCCDQAEKRCEELEAKLAAVEAETTKQIETELLTLATHIKYNANKLAQWESEKDEARCRELCAMYLTEFVHNRRAIHALQQVGQDQIAAARVTPTKGLSSTAEPPPALAATTDESGPDILTGFKRRVIYDPATPKVPNWQIRCQGDTKMFDAWRVKIDGYKPIYCESEEIAREIATTCALPKEPPPQETVWHDGVRIDQSKGVKANNMAQRTDLGATWPVFTPPLANTLVTDRALRREAELDGMEIAVKMCDAWSSTLGKFAAAKIRAEIERRKQL